MQTRTYYPTIILSDIHIDVEGVTDFLKSVNCNKLILNGDIIDGWQFQKNGKNKWKKKYSEFLKVIMAMIDNFRTKQVPVHIEQECNAHDALKVGTGIG
ncbi:MAG: hypothetical protein FWF54_06475 [Candidatus Azobacteroides sp.]|nr:hypothetical protein [Candidatus Azobacteroides sp.]